MITYRTRWLTRREVWFGEQPNHDGADVLIYMQSPDPVPGVHCQEFATLVVDLTRETEQLLDAMPKNTRYEIRRAESKDGIEYQAWDDAHAAFEPFCRAYDDFAALKQLPRADRIRLRGFLGAGMLDLTRVRSAEGHELVWHAYYRNESRARLLLSASLRRAELDPAQHGLVGRANRYHHWRDILRFKDAGIATYDLGGWYTGDADAAMLGINRFKEGFGGQLVSSYTGEQAVTFKARIAAWLNKALRR